MRNLFILLFVCVIFASSVIGQEPEKAEPESSIKKITLAKNGEDGFIIEDPPGFRPDDIPILCYVDLNETTPTLIKAVFVAVKAKGLRSNAVVVSLKYETRDGESGAAFNARPKSKWAEGDYRVDIYLDGKLVETRDFVISSIPAP